jgi:succinyl-CoA synthetase beta subunit
MGRNMNKSDVEEMIDLVLSDPHLKQKFSKLITSIMEEDSALKANLAELFAKEARRKRYNV